MSYGIQMNILVLRVLPLIPPSICGSATIKVLADEIVPDPCIRSTSHPQVPTRCAHWTQPRPPSARDLLFTVHHKRRTQLHDLLFIYAVERGMIMRQALSALDCVHSGKESLAFFKTTSRICSSGSALHLIL